MRVFPFRADRRGGCHLGAVGRRSGVRHRSAIECVRQELQFGRITPRAVGADSRAAGIGGPVAWKFCLQCFETVIIQQRSGWNCRAR